MNKPLGAAPDAAASSALPAVVDNDRAISGWLSVQEILARKKLIDDVMRKVMRPGEHYGPSFPGDKKQNLLKPGADTLLMTFQLVPSTEVAVIDLPGGHRDYRITVPIRTMGGLLVAIGVGSCSTMEKKYRWRYAKAKCPGCGAEALMASKFREGEWYCNPKDAGCGGNFPSNRVKAPDQAKVENADIADVWNTCLKIAKKRALVDGTISATGCSDIFTQDAEDLEEKLDAEEGNPSRSTAERTEQVKQQDAARRDQQAKPATGAVQPAAPGASPAAAAAAAGVNAEAQLVADLDAEYKGMQALAGPKTAAKVWKFYGKDKRAERLTALRDGNKALKAIIDRLGPKSDDIFRDILQDRENPDDVPGIIADLVRAAGSLPAAAGEDEPPF